MGSPQLVHSSRALCLVSFAPQLQYFSFSSLTPLLGPWPFHYSSITPEAYHSNTCLQLKHFVISFYYS